MAHSYSLPSSSQRSPTPPSTGCQTRLSPTCSNPIRVEFAGIRTLTIVYSRATASHVFCRIRIRLSPGSLPSWTFTVFAFGHFPCAVITQNIREHVPENVVAFGGRNIIICPWPCVLGGASSKVIVVRLRLVVPTPKSSTKTVSSPEYICVFAALVAKLRCPQNRPLLTEPEVFCILFVWQNVSER